MVISLTQLFFFQKKNWLHRWYPIEILFDWINDKPKWQLMKVIKRMDSFLLLILSNWRVFRRRTNTTKLSFFSPSFFSFALPLTVSFCTHMCITSVLSSARSFFRWLPQFSLLIRVILSTIHQRVHGLEKKTLHIYFYWICHRFGMLHFLVIWRSFSCQ